MNPLIKRLAGGRENARLLIFNYHNIRNDTDVEWRHGISIAELKAQLNWLRNTFEVLPLRQAVYQCRQGDQMKPTAAITFDDGYETQFTLASAVLNDLDLPATFFIASGHLGQEIHWNDWLELFYHHAEENEWIAFFKLITDLKEGAIKVGRKKNLSEYEQFMKYLSVAMRTTVINYIKSVLSPDIRRWKMMSAEDVKKLHSMGFEIGAHTVSHPILELEDTEYSDNQISTDIKELSKIIGEKVTSFAFPNGKPLVDYSEEHLRLLVKNQVSIALTSALGHFSPGYDPLQISRVCLSGTSDWGYLKTTCQAYRASYNIVKSRGYEAHN